MPDKDMKKILLTFCFAVLGMLTSAYAQVDDISPETIVVEDTVKISYFVEDTIKTSYFVPNWFIGASIGGSYSMGENTRFGNFFDMTRPSFQIQVGKNFYPQFGMRLTLNYLSQKGRAEWSTSEFLEKWAERDGNYDFSMAAGFIDGIIDFHNILWPNKEKRFFSMKGYLGLGGFYTFGFDDNKIDWLLHPTWKDCNYNGVHHNAGDLLPSGYGYTVNSKNKWYFAGHIGLIFDFRLSDAWSLNADVSFNGTDDAYNGMRFRRVYDSYVDLMFGAIYYVKDRNGNRHRAYKELIVKSYYTPPIEDVEPVVIENVHYNEMLQTTVSFYIDKTFVTDAQRRNVRSVAKFMEMHPNLDVVVTGYADAQTAYPKYNMMLSQKRAQAVYDLLVNEYHVDPNRLSMDYMGDEKQPFPIVNEWNRAVVFYIKPHDDSFKPSIEDKANDIKLNSHESKRLDETDSKETRSPF
jgi:outer membrane protein OmpA-like peptidoglycan-associated protein